MRFDIELFIGMGFFVAMEIPWNFSGNCERQ